MKLCILLVLGTLLVLINGMPPISRDYNTHCRCLQVESRIIPPDSLRSIKLVPQGPHCPETEVIAGLMSGEKVCLNPQSAWVKKLIHFVLERQLNPQGGPLAKNQA
ncbi:interleukin-8-like [Mastacembelus armatus]|uniref:Chemokine (C-X-C motif) ligand 19 n=1 Tax=Mastacembelus armatus TaxID=205130 RepID=A0A7N8Y7Q7_9TELE|nr:interleukin-8-like [Mastacembelus armatus]